jgi:outer membrane protein TolC
MPGLAQGRSRPRWVRRLLLAGLVAALGGCTRQHFRERADKDVAGVLTQKNVFPDWKIENWFVYPHPKSRAALPACPDHPPYPPDDYAAHLLSPNPQKPQKKYGAGRTEGQEYLKQIELWDAENRSATPEEPQTPVVDRYAPDKGADAARGAAVGGFAAAPSGDAAVKPVGGFDFAFKTEERPYRLTLEQAVELALFNSREFQDRREDLYLSALPVTAERFSFAAQAFASETAVREFAGRERGDAGNRWRLATEAGISKLFPTGATLLFRFANQVVLDLTSPRPDIAISNLSLTFIQPLLRGGGFAVTLEALTQAERTLLYAIRSYARFRKVFYVAIAGTGDYTNNPYGLQGLAANLGRAIGNNLTAPTSGFQPVILRAATLENEKKNLAALDQILKLYLNLKEGGVVSDLQVVRVELQYLQSQSRLLDSNRQYLDQLDNFKLQLGVPTNLPIELDDGPLRPMKNQVRRIEQVYDQLLQVQAEAGKYDPAEQPARYRQRWNALLTESALVKDKPFAKKFPERMAELAKLADDNLKKWIDELVEKRRKLLDERADRQKNRQPEPAETEAVLTGIDDAIDYARFEQALRRFEAEPWLRLPMDRQAGLRAALFRSALDAGTLVALTARNQRLDEIREAWPALPPIVVDDADLMKLSLDEASTKVAQTALNNRLDLMNARAQVVDSYRQIAVRANALQGFLDVQYDLNTATPTGDNEAFAFAGSRTRHALTLRAEPPFVRRVERNNYRASLISYQRQRRTLMAFEDNIINDCRADLRQLRSLAETYKVQQRSVELAFAQVDNARSTLLAPPDPTAREAAGSSAALTEQLLQAQNQLLQAQTALYTGWINYLNTRMNLYLDLELLPLDTRGLWTDDLPQPQPPAAP